MLSKYGYNFSTGRSMTAFFEIIHSNVLSEDDLDTVQRTDPGIKALWLELFTNSLQGMLHHSLNINAKHAFAGNIFPPRGALPPPDFGLLLGLQF
jgi:hypothetical protein